MDLIAILILRDNYGHLPKFYKFGHLSLNSHNQQINTLFKSIKLINKVTSWKLLSNTLSGIKNFHVKRLTKKKVKDKVEKTYRRFFAGGLKSH